jgi:hypothetical protein
MAAFLGHNGVNLSLLTIWIENESRDVVLLTELNNYGIEGEFENPGNPEEATPTQQYRTTDLDGRNKQFAFVPAFPFCRPL